MKFNVAFKIRAKNGELQKFIDQKGWKQSDFARELGISPSHVGKLFNMENCPSKKLLDRISKLTKKVPEDLFPQFLKNRKIIGSKKNFTIYKEIDINYLPESPNISYLPEYLQDYDKESLKNSLNDCLNSLTTREAKVIRKRFGIDEIQNLTYEEIGQDFQVSRERIRQIEAKALRKLKHPSRRERLREFNESVI